MGFITELSIFREHSRTDVEELVSQKSIKLPSTLLACTDDNGDE